MKNKRFFAIALLLVLALNTALITFPKSDAQTTIDKETYPFIISCDDPIGVGQEMLIWFGITDMVTWPQPGWTSMTITVTRPDNKTETLGPFNTDTTGGTGTIYVPTMVGTYYLQAHFPQQLNIYEDTRNGIKAGTVMLASDSKVTATTVQETPIQYYSGVPLPTEYWTRPINQQFREWRSISGSYLETSLSTAMVVPHTQILPYTQGPESAHVLWRTQAVLGGLAGAELGDYGFDDGSAYEQKFTGFVIGGILLRNVAWPPMSHYQALRATDLRTGEELWFKEGLRMDFGQLMYFGTMNMQGTFGYIWSINGTTWKAYDPYTGQWWFTLTNVPSGHRVHGPNGEILIYTINNQNGWMTLWNSSNIRGLMGVVNDFYANSWEPYGKTINATGPVVNAREFGSPTNNPLGLEGYMWNVSIPKLSGEVVKIRGDIALGWNSSAYRVSPNPLAVWAISLKPETKGQLLWSQSYAVPGDQSWFIRDASYEDNVFTIISKDTLEWYGYSLTTGNKLWGPSEPQDTIDWAGFAQTWWPDVIYNGTLYSGSFSGVLHAYDVKTGELLWKKLVSPDPYAESRMGNSYALGIYRIADGKMYMGYIEHSFNNPKPRGGSIICLDLATHEILWKFDAAQHYRGDLPFIADGVLVFPSYYDQNDYAVGKGPSAITVTAPDAGVSFGSSVTIKGMVTDISPGTQEYALNARFPNGIPAASDESMTQWMEYVYLQYPRPTNTTGVEVTLSVVDANGNNRDIGTTTSDADGFYSFSWLPDIEGKYTVTASFDGSKSYYPSHVETAFNVDPAAATPAPTQALIISAADTYLLPGIVVIVVAIAVVGVVLALLVTKKRP